MLRTPPSARKRARLLEQPTGQENSAIVPADSEGREALEHFRQQRAQNDKDLVSKLQAENAMLSDQLQAAQTSSRKFQVQQLCLILQLPNQTEKTLSCRLPQGLSDSANKQHQALLQSMQHQFDQLEEQLRQEIEHSSVLHSQKQRLAVEYVSCEDTS